jgi:hypothetical protein
VGYSTAWNSFDDEKQGKFLARQWLVNLMNDVPLSIWYDWHDDGPDSKEAEHRFGTVGHEYHKNREPVYDPKPSYLAARTLVKQLKGFRFNKRLMLQSPDDYVLLFSREISGKTEVKLVVWTTGVPHRVLIPTSSTQFSGAHTWEGPIKPPTAGKNGLSVELTDAPQYFTPFRPNELLLIAAAWERLPLEVVTTAPAAPKVSAALRNPLSHPVEASLGTQGASQVVSPRKTANLSLSPQVRRDANATPLRVTLNIRGQTRVVQQTSVIVTNPLRLTLFPPVNGRLPLLIETLPVNHSRVA